MKTHSLHIRAIVWALVLGQLLLTVPVAASQPAPSGKLEPWTWIDFAAQEDSREQHVVSGFSRTVGSSSVGLDFSRAQGGVRPPRTRRITPNRTVPHVDPVPLEPIFSETPTDQEIFRARVFPEPLVPVMATSAAENEALVRAIKTNSANRIAPFETFLANYPSSAWRPSLLANLGVLYLQSGRPGKALQSWDAAWQGTKHDTALMNRAVADFSVGNWLHLSMNMGRVDALVERLAEVQGRSIGGQAGSKVKSAREGLWILQYHHEMAAGSGPMALNSILRSQTAGEYEAPSALEQYHAVPQGATLTEMQELAGRVGLNYQMAYASNAARIPVPSLVHFKTDHFSAVLEESGNRYRLRDVIFGGDAWVTREALLEESSGYFLVGDGDLGDGWRSVTNAEGAAIIGHCAPGLPDDEDPCPCGGPGMGGGGGGPAGGGGGSGNGKPPMFAMPIYDFMPNRAALRISDAPVGYSPPKGPSVYFKMTYTQLDIMQPQIFTYWNAGPKWTFDWLSYVVENPANYVGAKVVYLRGGGREQYGNNPHWRSAASLVQVSSSPIKYERRMGDGSIEVFAQSDGATSGERRIFLTEIIDPRGQKLTLTYDSSLRLVGVTDALGQVTVLDYEHPADTLKVTSITDPFGRTAVLTYTTAGQLASITDVIGLTSSFVYGPADFVTSMTTPYGTTAFRHEPSPTSSTSYRMIEATDPLGGTERLEFHWRNTNIPATALTGQVPTGFSERNSNLDYYNTLYWDKRAWALHPGDVSKATLYKWLNSPSTDPLAYHGASTAIPHSTKRPLENRVWYAYAGQQSGGTRVGSYRQPITTARVLDDGTSQIWATTYNSKGNVTSQTDPLGRETSYTYATNGIDLLEVRQTTGSLNDLLASYADYTSGHQAETMVDAAGETTTFTYSSAGQVLTVTNALSETTTYAYDTDGYLTSVTGPVIGATTTYVYDDYGRVESVTDTDSYEVVTEYDLLDRPIEIAYPDSTTEVITYDKLDAIKRRDREGKITRTFYDALRRLVAVRDPLGRTTTQQWCGCGSLDKLIDPKGQSTTWERDIQGRVTREVRADGTTDTDYSYETTTSRLKTLTDPKGQVTTFSYAADDRMLQMAFTNETISTPDVSFTYETNYPRLSTMVDGTGTTTYTHKPSGTWGAGQVASVDGPLTNDTITMTYDDLGRMTARLINGYGISSMEYDALGRLTEETNELGTFTYDFSGHTRRLESVNYPNGQTSTYSYFGNSGDRRLQTIHHQTSAPATLSKFDYTYSADGNILTWRQQSGTNAVMWEYGYDAGEQLARVVKKSTDPTPLILKRYDYAYDAAGNRTIEQIDDAVAGASYNNLNRLTSQQPSGAIRVTGTVSESATVTIQGQPATVSSTGVFDGTTVIPSGTSAFTVRATDTNSNVTSKTYEVESAGSTKTYTYDANGNMTSDGSRTFEWDARNQLVAVTVGTVRNEFVYDGLRRRVRMTEKESGITQSDTRVVWCAAEICEERGSDGTSVVRRAFGRGEQVAEASRYFAIDHLGSVTEVTDETGELLTQYEFDPWGRRSLSAGNDITNVGYTGHHWEAGGSVSLTLYRAYDADIGRWLSEDPGGRVDGLNLYRYSRNSPVRYSDIVGLWAGAGGGSVGAGGAIGGMGGHFGAGCSIAIDDSGGVGLLCCYSFGYAFGFGAGAGPDITGELCPGCSSICDLEGDDLLVQVHAPTMGGSGGGGGGTGPGTVSVSIGPEGGVGGFGSITVSTCKLILSNRDCDPCKN
jgi:RHS repeat-associated protein